MSDKRQGNALPASVPSGPARPVIVSTEFIEALRQAGARQSVVAVLEKERAAQDAQEKRQRRAAG
jgi:hypothetical protein